MFYLCNVLCFCLCLSCTSGTILIINKAFVNSRLRPAIATPPEENRTKTTGDLQNKFREDRSSDSRDSLCSQTDRQTDKQTNWSQYSAPHTHTHCAVSVSRPSCFQCDQMLSPLASCDFNDLSLTLPWKLLTLLSDVVSSLWVTETKTNYRMIEFSEITRNVPFPNIFWLWQNEPTQASRVILV